MSSNEITQGEMQRGPLMRCHIVVLPVITLLFDVATVPAEEWPGWRGPRGDGSSLETGIPTRWSTKENIIWRAAIPGKGHSSPIV